MCREKSGQSSPFWWQPTIVCVRSMWILCEMGSKMGISEFELISLFSDALTSLQVVSRDQQRRNANRTFVHDRFWQYKRPFVVSCTQTLCSVPLECSGWNTTLLERAFSTNYLWLLCKWLKILKELHSSPWLKEVLSFFDCFALLCDAWLNLLRDLIFYAVCSAGVCRHMCCLECLADCVCKSCHRGLCFHSGKTSQQWLSLVSKISCIRDELLCCMASVYCPLKFRWDT